MKDYQMQLTLPLKTYIHTYIHTCIHTYILTYILYDYIQEVYFYVGEVPIFGARARVSRSARPTATRSATSLISVTSPCRFTCCHSKKESSSTRVSRSGWNTSFSGLKGRAPPTKPEGRGVKVAGLALAKKEEMTKDSGENEEDIW